MALAVAGVIAIAAGLTYWLNHVPALTERDAILIADFVNTTDDPVLGDALNHALAVQLEQSPFLNIFPDESVGEALRLMAMAEFDKVRQNRGWDPTSPLFPLAHLKFARAAALAGDLPASRNAYEELFRFWKDADPTCLSWSPRKPSIKS